MDFKTFPVTDFKVDGDGTGRYGGYVAVFGNVDLGGDLIEAGAFKDSLGAFVRNGFLAWGHDYSTLPIGMVDEAHEDAVGLFMAGPFHSTPFAQDARKTAAERLAAGKPMGMSIGYEAKAWEFRKIAGQRGPFGEEVRVLTAVDVLEGSLVPMPMNPLASLTDVKGYGLPFDDQAARVRVALGELVARARSGSEIRAESKEGRPISSARRAQLTTVHGQLGDAHGWLGEARDAIGALLEETAPAKALDPLAEFARFQQFVARRNGVAV